MSDDKPMKSAYELAMERLRAKDREGGVEESKPLTDEQKQEIARLRQEATAKFAEAEIVHRDAVAAAAAAGDADKIREIHDKFQIDKERIESRLESAIARVRRGEPATPSED
jgi:Spy/CpxP family protein refolding chaperone